jgi:hypothetical protein
MVVAYDRAFSSILRTRDVVTLVDDGNVENPQTSPEQL